MKKLLLLTFIYLSGIHFYLYSQDCPSENNIYEFYYYGKKYELVTEKSTWDDAFECAKLRGGYLVTIEDKLENDFLVDYLKNQFFNIHGIKLFEDSVQNRIVYIGSFKYKSFWRWLPRDENDTLRDFFEGISVDNGNKINDYYTNWGQINGKQMYPIDGFGRLSLSLDPYFDSFDNQIKSEVGQWINERSPSLQYYIIEYNCTDTTSFNEKYLSCSGVPKVYKGDTIRTSQTLLDTLYFYPSCVVYNTIDIQINNLDTNTYLDGITLKNTDSNADKYEWYFCENDSLVSNKRFNFTPEFSGDYKLKITEGGCEYVSDCYYICRPTTFAIDTTKCKNESITINGVVYEDRGFYKQFLTQENFDCDSTLEINIEDIYINTNLRKQNGGIVAVQTDAEYQWYDCDGDIVIEGETGQGYFPIDDGLYKASVSKDGCTEFTDCVEYKTETSVKDINESELFTIDTKSKVIYIDQKTKYNSITLLDLNSKSIYKTKEYVQKIDIGNLPVGIYFLKVETDSVVKVFKFVVGG